MTILSLKNPGLGLWIAKSIAVVNSHMSWASHVMNGNMCILMSSDVMMQECSCVIMSIWFVTDIAITDSNNMNKGENKLLE